NDLPSTLERGTETELDGAFINSDGEVSDVDPTWTLLEEPSGVELDGQKLLVTDQAETDQTFTLQAEYDGYKSQQEISIIGNKNEYTINIIVTMDKHKTGKHGFLGMVLTGMPIHLIR